MRRTSRKRRIRPGLVLRHLVASALGLVFIFPVAWTLLTSLKTKRQAFASPPLLLFKPNLQNYIDVLRQGSFGHHAFNSLVIVLVSTVLAVLLGALAAYGLTRIRVPGSMLIAVLILLTRFVPPISTVIPLFLLSRTTHTYDSQVLMILVYMAINIPYVIFMMRAFFAELPAEIEEAARIDGCSRFGTFLRVALPISGPGLAATAVLATLFSWNEFLYALTLTSSNATTLPLFMAAYVGDLGIDWPHMTASGILVLLPALVAVVFIQRWLAQGLTFGAVKG